MQDDPPDARSVDVIEMQWKNLLDTFSTFVYDAYPPDRAVELHLRAIHKLLEHALCSEEAGANGAAKTQTVLGNLLAFTRAALWSLGYMSIEVARECHLARGETR
jgi:hypothetical protein